MIVKYVFQIYASKIITHITNISYLSKNKMINNILLLRLSLMKKILCFLLLILAQLMSATSFASQSYTFDKEYIEQLGRDTIEKAFNITATDKLKISIHPLDPRIKVKPCSIPLTSNIPQKSYSRNVNIKISCVGTKPWHIFLSANIQIYTQVLTATTSIGRGSILDDTNTAIVEVPQQRVRGKVASSIKAIHGARAQRTITKGNPIYLKQICLVCKGEETIIIAKSDSFSIKSTGTPLNNASLGEQVRIKNENSGRIVSGRVSAVNTVIINL